MQESILAHLLQSLAFSAPTLLVSLIAFVIAIVRFRHHKAASILAIAAALVLSLGTMSTQMIRVYVIHAQTQGAIEIEQMGAMMTMISVAGTFAHTLGLSLLVAGVFVGRGSAADVVVLEPTDASTTRTF